MPDEIIEIYEEEDDRMYEKMCIDEITMEELETALYDSKAEKQRD